MSWPFKKDYQQDGFVKAMSTKVNALTECNRQIAKAREATPEALRDLYRSQIRWHQAGNGYAWYWVLK